MKTACVALIRDVAKGTQHLEALPHLFDSAESVRLFAEHRLNERVTVVVTTLALEVEDGVKLLSFAPDQSAAG
jgi:hypothetical protein